MNQTQSGVRNPNRKWNARITKVHCNSNHLTEVCFHLHLSFINSYFFQKNEESQMKSLSGHTTEIQFF